MGADALVAALGHTSWEVGQAPREADGAQAKAITLAAFVAALLAGDAAASAQQAETVDCIHARQAGLQGVEAFFPEVPGWFAPAPSHPSGGGGGGLSAPSFAVKSAQFFVGPVGSGAPWRYQDLSAAGSWHALVHGKQGWVLAPPPSASASTVPAASLLSRLAVEEELRREFEESGGGGDEEKGRSTSLRCVVRAGDVVVIPAGWAHLSLSLAASVGLEKEFDVAAVPEELEQATAAPPHVRARIEDF